jgi:hypothetical protein
MAGKVPAGEGLGRVWVELVDISVLVKAELLPGRVARFLQVRFWV